MMPKPGDHCTVDACGPRWHEPACRPVPGGCACPHHDPDRLTCDICDGIESAADLTPDWNGETGCHRSCDAFAPPEPLERCTGGSPDCPHTDCPDGWHHGADLPCACTPDCALPAEPTDAQLDRLHRMTEAQAHYAAWRISQEAHR